MDIWSGNDGNWQSISFRSWDTLILGKSHKFSTKCYKSFLFLWEVINAFSELVRCGVFKCVCPDRNDVYFPAKCEPFRAHRFLDAIDGPHRMPWQDDRILLTKQSCWCTIPVARPQIQLEQRTTEVWWTTEPSFWINRVSCENMSFWTTHPVSALLRWLGFVWLCGV